MRQQLNDLLKRTHLELKLIILDDSQSHLKQVYLPLQEKVIPDPRQKLLLIKATTENLQKPRHHKHLRVDFKCPEMPRNKRQILIDQIVEELYSEVDLCYVALEEGEEVVAVHHVGEGDERVVLVEVAGEDLGEFEEVAHEADVGADHGEDLDEGYGLGAVGEVVDLVDLFLFFVVHLVQNGGDSQGVADYDWPQGLAAVWWQAVSPQCLKQWGFDRKYPFVFSSMNLVDLVPRILTTATELSQLLQKGLVFLLFWPFQSIIPVTVPIWENICIPNFLYFFFVEVCFEDGLAFLSVILPSMYEESPQVVDPFSPIIRIPRIQIQSPMFRDNGKTHGIKIPTNLIHPHDLRRTPQYQIRHILQQDEPGLIILNIRIHPQQLILLLRYIHPPHNPLRPIPTILDEDVPFGELDGGVEDLGDAPCRNVEIEVVEEFVDLLHIDGLGLELVAGYAVVHGLEVGVGDAGAYGGSVFYELGFGHFLLLHRVMGVGVQHYQAVAQDVDLVSIGELGVVTLKVDLRENIDYPLNLLCLPREFKLGEQTPERFIELQAPKIQAPTILPEYLQNPLLILAKILPQRHLINGLPLYQIPRNLLGRVLYLPLAHHILYRILRILREHNHEFLDLAVFDHLLLEVVQLLDEEGRAALFQGEGLTDEGFAGVWQAALVALYGLQHVVDFLLLELAGVRGGGELGAADVRVFRRVARRDLYLVALVELDEVQVQFALGDDVGLCGGYRFF